MRVLLDTSLLMPAIGVSVKGVDGGLFARLRSEGHELAVSEVSLVELSAKGAKLSSGGLLPSERVVRGVRAVAFDPELEKVPIHGTAVQFTAIQLRRLMSDYLDCLICASGIHWGETLVTSDDALLGLASHGDFRSHVSRVNPPFEIISIRDAVKKLL